MHCIYRKGALSNPSLKPYFQDGKTLLLSRLKQFPGFFAQFSLFSIRIFYLVRDQASKQYRWSFYKIDWLIWLRFWVLRHADTINTVYLSGPPPYILDWQDLHTTTTPLPTPLRLSLSKNLPMHIRSCCCHGLNYSSSSFLVTPYSFEITLSE